jgi:hypothetical protein
MNENDAMTQRITNAKRALTAYERAVFPEAPSLLPEDPLYVKAVLGALLCDLEHYADVHGIDFEAASATGRAAHDDEVAEQIRYQAGDQVRLRRPGGNCGIVAGVQGEPDGDPNYLVEIPGVPYLVTEPARRLEPAPPFPLVTTQLGEMTRADQAEKALIKLAARNRGLAPATEATLRADCARLLDALSTWSGTPQRELLQDLGAGLAERITGRPTPRSATFRQELKQAEKPMPNSAVPDRTAARLASRDFPYEVADGIPPRSANPVLQDAGSQEAFRSRPRQNPHAVEHPSAWSAR